MIEIESLRPSSRRRVIDLVRDAGIDVSDWANYGNGRKPAAANPKYCYEWAFVEPGKVVVLNLWYADLRVRVSVFRTFPHWFFKSIPQQVQPREWHNLSYTDSSCRGVSLGLSRCRYDSPSMTRS
jgi:hypothetical protein